jgi:thiol-disulfide isomerase/thioredoxin
MNKSTLSLAVAALALVTGVALGLRYHAALTPAPISAHALFAQTFDDVEGRPQPISQWQGRLLVVNFWATWCAPCVEEMPELQSMHTEYAARGVTVIGLAIDNAAAVRQFRDRLRLDLPLLVAGAAGSDLGRQLGNSLGALPYTAVINTRGQVVRSKLGRVRAAELRAWLDEMLTSTG